MDINNIVEKGVAWDLLVQSAIRERAYETISAQGASLQMFSGNPNVPPQIVRMMIYPHVLKSGKGLLHNESEGMSQKISHVGLCNYVTANIPNAPNTDIQFGDRITDSYGRMYRVEAVEDDGGMRDHMLLALLTISPNGDA